MSRLEERYRSVLRLLPEPYRRLWGDDMVDTFLEGTETGDAEAAEYAADYGRPSMSETASVVALAVRLRLGGIGASPRDLAWGQAVRLAALMMMLTHAVMAAAALAETFWSTGQISWLPGAAVTTPPGGWHAVAEVAGFGWLPAYVVLVLGHRSAAQAVALLAIVATAIPAAVNLAGYGMPFFLAPWTSVVLALVLLAALAAFHQHAPPVHRRRWLAALPIGVLAVPLPLFLAQATGHLNLVGWPALCCIVVVAATIVYLAGLRTGRFPATPDCAMALSLVAVAAFGLRCVTLLDIRFAAHHSALLTLGLVEAIAVLAAAAPVTVIAIRAHRRLPGGILA